MKKVAIVGGGPTRRLAPFDDHSWEIWGLGRRRWLRRRRLNRWFEMHSVQQIRAYRGNPRTKMNLRAYLRFLRSLRVPVYMQRRYPWVPKSRSFPLAEALREFGRCFTSSVSYMIACAILEGYDKIGLWGIDMSGKEEYVYQRSVVLYLLGVARARGIDVYLPPACPIVIPEHPEPVETKVLYGYDWDHPEAWWNQRERRKMKRRALRRVRRGPRRRLRRRSGRRGVGGRSALRRRGSQLGRPRRS